MRPTRRPTVPAQAGSPSTYGAREESPQQLPSRADHGSRTAAADGKDPADGKGIEVLPLLTPNQAAELLAVPESWLRRRAAARSVPCTFLGKHLRFSQSDVRAIATAAAQPAPSTTRHPAAGREPRSGRRR
jgi:excisionase family DNA binding protein